MHNFSDLAAVLDFAVQVHLGEDALYSTGSGEAKLVRIMIDHPRAADRLSGMTFTRSRPVIKVARAACPDLMEGHQFQLVLKGGVLGAAYEAAEAPVAEDDGRWWVVEVIPA